MASRSPLWCATNMVHSQFRDILTRPYISSRQVNVKMTDKGYSGTVAMGGKSGTVEVVADAGGFTQVSVAINWKNIARGSQNVLKLILEQRYV